MVQNKKYEGRNTKIGEVYFSDAAVLCVTFNYY